MCPFLVHKHHQQLVLQHVVWTTCVVYMLACIRIAFNLVCAHTHVCTSKNTARIQSYAPVHYFIDCNLWVEPCTCVVFLNLDHQEVTVRHHVLYVYMYHLQVLSSGRWGCTCAWWWESTCTCYGSKKLVSVITAPVIHNKAISRMVWFNDNTKETISTSGVLVVWQWIQWLCHNCYVTIN